MMSPVGGMQLQLLFGSDSYGKWIGAVWGSGHRLLLTAPLSYEFSIQLRSN